MTIRTWKKKAISSLLCAAVIGCYSMVALAGDTKLAGEIAVSGGNDAIVTVNGESVKSGRTVFSSSTIVTPANAAAVISVKNVGKVRVAPSSTLVVNFDEKGISGKIESGKLTVLDSVAPVLMTAPNGAVATLANGESVVTVPKDDHDKDSTTNWFIWAAIFGGAAAAIIFAAANNNNRIALGGGTTVVSPNI